MFPHLSRPGARVNVGQLQEAANREFLDALCDWEGMKVLFWEPIMFRAFHLVTPSFERELAERKVVDSHLLTADNARQVDQLLAGQPVKHLIFVCRPQLAHMDTIAAIVRRIEPTRSTAHFHLLCVPRTLQICDDQLKMAGVFGSLSVGQLTAANWFCLDNDVISMEWPNALRHIYVDRDASVLFAAAEALQSLRRRFGPIGRICGKGECAAKVWQLCRAMERDEADDRAADPSSSSSSSGAAPAIDQLIVLDRSVDLMSALATQLTYEGLIDEQFGIAQCQARFPADIFAAVASTSSAVNAQPRRWRDFALNSADELFAELRDRHFHGVGPVLTRHLRPVAAFQNFRDKEISEINAMVGDIPRMMRKKDAIAHHNAIAHALKQRTEARPFREQLQCEQEFLMCENVDRTSAFVEDAMARAEPLRSVLRLMCLQCQAGNGLRPKVLDAYKRDVAQAYGVEALLSVGNLERAGLLRVHSGQRTYAALRKTLALTVDDGQASEQHPVDISYVHGAYAPLTVRLVERALRRGGGGGGGWQALHDVLASLPGPTLNESAAERATDEEADGGREGARRSSLGSEQPQQRTVLVFFVGGCTFAEVAALRFVAQDEGSVEFVVATTQMLNKNSFLDGFIEMGADDGTNK